MKLRTLTMEDSEMATANTPPNVLPFRWLTHHVSEIYLMLLPKIEINGSSKISIIFGQIGQEVAFDNMFGVTSYFIEDFDFKNFYSLSSHEKELVLLAELKKSLLLIANRKKENKFISDLITATADEVIRSGFNLQIPIKKLEKNSADRRFKMIVHRILNANVGEAWRCTIIDKSVSTETEMWMTEVPDYLDRTDYYKRAEVKGNVYMIFDNLGRLTFQTNFIKK